MATDVVMPQMGESIFEGTITKWLKKPGDKVERDEPLFEISTDKVDAEIPSPSAGVLKEIKVSEGQTVPIQTVVAVIDGAGEQQRPHRLLRRQPRQHRLPRHPRRDRQPRPFQPRHSSPQCRNVPRGNVFTARRWCAAWRRSTALIWQRFREPARAGASANRISKP